MNLTAFGTVPLMMLYLKNGLNAPDNVIVLISACSLSGMLFGYLCIGRLLKRIGMKHTFLLLHFIFFAVNGGLFLIGGRSMATLPADRLFSAGLLFCGCRFVHCRFGGNDETGVSRE